MAVSPLSVSRQFSVDAVNRALAGDRLVLFLMQKKDVDDPTPDDLHRIGTVAIIRQMSAGPTGLRLLVEGIARVQADVMTRDGALLKALIQPKPEPAVRTVEVEAHVRHVQELVERALSVATGLSPDMKQLVSAIDDPLRLAYVLAGLLDLKAEDKQILLEEDSLSVKLTAIAQALQREIEVLELKGKIESQAQQEMTDAQRQYMLRQQLKAIQEELGEGPTELQELRTRLEKAALPDGVRETVSREVDRLERMSSSSPEYQMVRTYLDWIFEVPWSISTEDRLDPVEARRVLDADHYGLEKVKERIVEYLAVRKLKGDMKGPILCFVGPPGVGKTSLGQSIARAMNRKFVRLSLGGVRDEAEIRGHRRTYIGALPGRIVQAMKQAGSINPVFMLDELDKLTAGGFSGDPAAALLEVLDPAQNNTFRDHYLEVPLDLSKVLFIATANQLGPVHPALLDRMEIIELSGYSDRDKQQIARQYLIPRQASENGLPEGYLDVTDAALARVISEYTREAGVRSLERRIGALARKKAAALATAQISADAPVAATARVDVDDVPVLLGPPRFKPDTAFRLSRPGVATGLAWTEAGGDVLYIEAALMPSGTGQLLLTGQLGAVMQESARAALSHIRQQAAALGIDPQFLQGHDLHVHVPAGAIPKDGPSAGVTMATAIVSALRKQPVAADVAMTGEITLTGMVLPVGGVREKVLAANRLGLRTIILPERNIDDVLELPEEVRSVMRFIPAKTIDDVLAVALPTDPGVPVSAPE
ncbi:MAG: endopeptidase La [Acidobacteria bacterium]|nr:endopeptidase La [Acidobacteriota bacterium]